MTKMNRMTMLGKKFEEHFHYWPEFPTEAYLGEKQVLDDYEKLVDKCINDDFDYTIELYGTKPIPVGNSDDLMID